MEGLIHGGAYFRNFTVTYDNHAPPVRETVRALIKSVNHLIELSSLDIRGDQTGKRKVTLKITGEPSFATAASKLKDSPGSGGPSSFHL